MSATDWTQSDDPETVAQRIIEANACGDRRCPCHRTLVKGFGLAHCPAHGDRGPSLSISVREGRYLVHCQTGCSQSDVIDALREQGVWPERSAPPPTSMSLEDLAARRKRPPQGPGGVPAPGGRRPPNGTPPQSRGGVVPAFSAKRLPLTGDPITDAWLTWEHKTGIPRRFWEHELGVTYDAEHGALLFSFGEQIEALRYRPWPPERGLGKYLWADSRLTPPLWPTPEYDGLRTEVIITGGETDCATFRYAGYRAHTVCHGEGTTAKDTALTALRDHFGAKTLVFWFDLDDPGVLGAHKNAAAAHAAGVPCKVPAWPSFLALYGGKDAQDVWHVNKRDRASFQRITREILKTTPLWTPDAMPAWVREKLERQGHQQQAETDRARWGSRYRTGQTGRRESQPEIPESEKVWISAQDTQNRSA